MSLLDGLLCSEKCMSVPATEDLALSGLVCSPDCGRTVGGRIMQDVLGGCYV